MVDYAHSTSLRYALQGVDLVISTIGGPEQLKLISGAERARVRYFVPSEFEGCLAQRPTTDPLDRGSAEAIRKLEHILAQAGSHPMRYTVFSCGIFMERFQPGGLGQLRMGASSGVQEPGDYLVDIAATTAEIVEHNERGERVQVCMTSVYDVVKFVAAAIEMGPRHWPREYNMRGDLMTVRDIVGLCSNFREGMNRHEGVVWKRSVMRLGLTLSPVLFFDLTDDIGDRNQPRSPSRPARWSSCTAWRTTTQKPTTPSATIITSGSSPRPTGDITSSKPISTTLSTTTTLSRCSP